MSSDVPPLHTEAAGAAPVTEAEYARRRAVAAADAEGLAALVKAAAELSDPSPPVYSLDRDV